jgi:hypothetical protein
MKAIITVKTTVKSLNAVINIVSGHILDYSPTSVEGIDDREEEVKRQ